MKGLKRFSSIFMVLAMSLTLVTAFSYAENELPDDNDFAQELTDATESTDTTQELTDANESYDAAGPTRGGSNKYDIYNADDLYLIEEDPYGNYTLKADIDLSGVDWVPLCLSGPFYGNFDGEMHTISGIHCESAGEDELGLFYSNNGTIRNLMIGDSNFEGSAPVFGAVAVLNTGIIDNCEVTCDITGYGEIDYMYAGGVTGINSGEVTNCVFCGNISIDAEASAGGIYAGGIAGINESVISDCQNSGSISADNTAYSEYTCCGGIAGSNESGKAGEDDEETADNALIDWCSNEGDVEACGGGTVYAGGIAGNATNYSFLHSSSNSGRVSGSVLTDSEDNWVSCGGIAGYMTDSEAMYCYNTAEVTADSDFSDTYTVSGGIAGTQDGESSITQCYNTGAVSSMTRAGGICGENSSYITDCYNTAIISVPDTGEAAGGITGCNFGDALIEKVYNVGKALGGDTRGGISGFNECLPIGTGCITANYSPDPEGRNWDYEKMLARRSFTGTGFDFEKIWEMGYGMYEFPILSPVADMKFQNDINLCECIGMHQFGAWRTTTIPTATTLGIDTRICNVCGKEETKTSTPTGSITILNTIANSAKKTNNVIWDKSKVKGASNYQINWRARGAATWASRNVGNTVRGTTSGLTIGNLYEIRVRPYAVDTVTRKPVYGSWSNTVYRYFHTTERIRLASKSKGTFTMSWKVNPKATSYQVLYTTNKNGSGAAQNIKTAGKGASSITVKDIKVNGKTQALKSGTTYYVQVREIRNVGGTNYIGNISCPVAVKVK
ncbi:MAG: fibronectin type III domain-containing protein [Mogibacterium sp.]|nr:fibronectin type III domain-containing protein [Mogibacterium sp.]